MPVTASLYPTAISAGYPTGATWTTSTNAVGSTAGTVAVFTTATNAAVGAMLLEGYGVPAAIGLAQSSAFIRSVAVTVASYEATTARWSGATAQLYTGTTAIGSSQALTLSTTTTNTQTLTFPGVSWTQAADLRVMVTATKSGTQSSTFNLDFVGIAVTYARPSVIWNAEFIRRATRSR